MNKKAYLPHIYAILVFFLVIIVYFSPLWQGKSLGPHDILQYQGMAKEIQDNRIKYNEEPFWTNSMFSGMPNTMINMNQYGNLVHPIHHWLMKITAYPSSLILVSMLCFYIMLLALNVNYILAAIGAFAFAFGSFNIIGLIAGHNAKLACISYMPLVFAGLIYAYRQKLLLGCSLFGFGLAMQIVNNHIQITYYLAFICVIYVLVEFYHASKNKKIVEFAKTSTFLLIIAIVALGTHAGYFLSINEYSKYSIRGKTELKPIDSEKEAVRADGLDREYVFNYSSSLTEPLTFLMADYMGGASSGPVSAKSETANALRENGVDPQNIRQFIANVPLYFGDQPYVSGPFYIGAIICFLFVLGLIIVTDRIKWVLLASTFIGIILMYGKNLPSVNYLLFDYFPLYNKFRSVTMAEIIPQFCMSILGIMGVQKIIDTPNKNIFTKSLIIAASTTAGLCLLVFAVAGSGDYSNPSDQMQKLPDWLLTALESDRKSMRTGDALRSFLFILAAVGLIYTFIINKINKNVALIGLGILVLADIWLVDKRYLNSNSFEKNTFKNFYTPTEADQLILEDKDVNYRVFNLQDSFGDARTSYFHKSIGGYSPAKLRRYQDLIERKISNEQEIFIENIQKGSMAFEKIPVINMLNTRYILAGQDARSVLYNDSAAGNAWFVKEIITVNTPDEEIAALKNFNPKQTAFINKSRFSVSKNNFNTDTSSKIILSAYKPYNLTYQCKSTNDGFAVFSEIYYPLGWTATIDGKEVEIKQVNYVLRALEIPAGDHIINFKMVNKAYTLGNTIGIVSSLLLYLGLIAAIVITVKNKKTTAN